MGKISLHGGDCGLPRANTNDEDWLIQGTMMSVSEARSFGQSLIALAEAAANVAPGHDKIIEMPSRLRTIDIGYLADSELRERNLRRHFFSEMCSTDAAWAMMLDLFVQTREGRTVSVTSLCGASGVPQTTSLRYIAVLVDSGLAHRRDCANDHRRTYIELTAHGMQQILEYLKAKSNLTIRHAGRGIALRTVSDYVAHFWGQIQDILRRGGAVEAL